MIYAIDRIIGNIAVLMSDMGEILEIGIECLPYSCKEGDLLKKDLNGNFYIDEELTLKRSQSNSERLKRLMGK